MLARALIGAVLAALVVAVSRRLGALSTSGQWAAFGVGVVATTGGWAWAAMLMAYFVAATALTHMGAATKAARTRGTLPQPSARTAAQVLANGAPFALLALAAGDRIWTPWSMAASGALAAASADTWATELGIQLGGTPRSILTGARMAPGMSGGVTLIGMLAAMAGAALIAGVAAAIGGAPHAGRMLVVVGGAGVVGAVADSAVGAAVQVRRWCDPCRAWTERAVHVCGHPTIHAAGQRWCTNDVVNLLASCVGAAAAVGLARLVP